MVWAVVVEPLQTTAKTGPASSVEVGHPGYWPVVVCCGTLSGLSGVPSGNWRRMVCGSVNAGSRSRSPARTMPAPLPISLAQGWAPCVKVGAAEGGTEGVLGSVGDEEAVGAAATGRPVPVPLQPTRTSAIARASTPAPPASQLRWRDMTALPFRQSGVATT